MKDGITDNCGTGNGENQFAEKGDSSPQNGMGQGQRIKEARGRMSQAELARKVGKSQQTIADWERERTEPSLDDFQRLAAATGRTATWLAFGDAPPGLATSDPKLQLIYEIIVAVATFCQQAQEELPPEDLGRLVITLYSMHPQNDEPYQLPAEVRNVIILRRR